MSVVRSVSRTTARSPMPDVAQRVQRVEALRRRHAHVVAPQDADEVVDDPVHGGQCV